MKYNYTKGHIFILVDRKLLLISLTCYVKFYFQRHPIGQSCISEELIGFFQCPVLSGDTIDWQEAVTNLQQATSTQDSVGEGDHYNSLDDIRLEQFRFD